MSCETGNKLLAGWMDNQLTEAERMEMDIHLAQCAACREQMEANRQLWLEMGAVGVPAPSERMQVRFDAMLDTYKASAQKPGVVDLLRGLFAVRPGFTWAYSVCLMVIGLGIGFFLFSRPGGTKLVAREDKDQMQALTTQVHEMKEMMLLALLENPSASERIRGVSYTSEIASVNKNVINALLSTLNNDANNNVRLMTLEALTHYADEPAVREGLVQSILQQESPLVQAAMADVMLKLQEKKAVQPLKQLLQQKNLNEMVRTKVEQTLTRLI